MDLPLRKARLPEIGFARQLPGQAAQPEQAGRAAVGLLILLYALEFLGMHDKVPILKTVHLHMILGICLAAVVFTAGDFRNVCRNRLTVLFLTLIFFTLVGLSYSLVKMKTFSALKSQVGYFILFAGIAQLLNTEKRLRAFLMAALAVHFAVILLNIGSLTTGTRTAHINAAYFLGDGNDFAWSLSIMLPFALYFLLGPGFFSRVMGTVAIPALLFGLVMTMSRGAFVAVSGSLLNFTLWTRRKFPALLIIAAIAGITVFSAPQLFWDRMDPSGYMEGSSTTGRLQAWNAATQMALDYPLGVGAGNFQSVYGRFYMDEFSDPIQWASRRWISPHSIYFGTLAEYGFIGLLLLLAIIGEMLRLNWKLRQRPESGHLPVCLSMSIVAFALGGVFLGGVRYPHIYILGGLTLACVNTFRRKSS